MTDIAFPYAQESAAVEEAASRALQLIDSFLAQEQQTTTNNNNNNNPWRHPETILQSLDEARNELTTAWTVLSSKMAQDDENTSVQHADDVDFRVVYMNMMTDAFADVLEDLRQNDADFNVDVLVDCLQSGMELLSDRDLWMKSDDEQSDDLTPHERRRRALGYSPDESS